MTLDALTPMLRTWDLHAAIAFYVEVLRFAVLYAKQMARPFKASLDLEP
jgi:hypothetical protein